MNLKMGQIWQDWDIRFRNHLKPRLLKVINFPNDLMVQVQNIDTGRKTIISKHRMKPNATGYKLVENIKESG